MGIERRFIAGAIAIASLLPQGSPENPSEASLSQSGIIIPSYAQTTEISINHTRLGEKLSNIPRAELKNVVHLTKEGYGKFLKSINNSYMGEASQYGEFNTDLLPIVNKIPALPLKYVVLHYTVAYYNSPQYPRNARIPQGEFYPPTFISAAVHGKGLSCCAAHEVVDRDGRDFRFAPSKYRLRHIAGFDANQIDFNSQSYGIEIEAGNHGLITNKQLETALYSAANILIENRLLEKYSLEESFVGHGQKWKEFATTNPLIVKHNPKLYPVKTDNTADQMKEPRSILKEFLTQEMGIKLLS